MLAFLRNWRVTLVAMVVVPMSVLITVVLLFGAGHDVQHHDVWAASPPRSVS